MIKYTSPSLHKGRPAIKTVYLHIGYHKTATTFLQNSIFPELKQVNYIKKKDIDQPFHKIRMKRNISDSEIEEIRDELLRYDDGQPMFAKSFSAG